MCSLSIFHHTTCELYCFGDDELCWDLDTWLLYSTERMHCVETKIIGVSDILSKWRD